MTETGAAWRCKVPIRKRIGARQRCSVGKVLTSAMLVGAVPAMAQPRDVAGRSRDVQQPLSLYLPSAVASAPVSLRENDIRITPALSVAYDDNIFRTIKGASGREDELIVAPSVTAQVDRVLAGAQVTASALYGYEVFTFHPDRSRPRIALNARGTAGIAGTCSVTPYGEYRRERTDFGDLNAPLDNTIRTSRFGATATCQRPAGLYPLLSAERYQSSNDGEFEYADQRTTSGVVGIGYRRPSLGQALAYYRRDDIVRPNQVRGDSSVDRAGVAIDRAVSPLLTASVDLHWLSVRSQDPLIEDYGGLGWRAQIVSRALAPLKIEATAARSVVFDTLLTTAYAVQSSYSLVGQMQVNELTSATLGFDYRTRDFRAPPNGVRGGLEKDQSPIFRAGLARQMTGRLFLRLDATHSRRKTEPSIGDFDATRVTASAEMRF